MKYPQEEGSIIITSSVSGMRRTSNIGAYVASKHALVGITKSVALELAGKNNPDKLRRSSETVDFVRRFFEKKKLIAAICHGPQLLIDAEIING